jgi:hypothetical protein
MKDYWFAPLTALDPEETQDDRLRKLFTLRQPPQSSGVHDPGNLVTVHQFVEHLKATLRGHSPR